LLRAEPLGAIMMAAATPLWICLAALLALVIGVLTGALAFIGGANVANSTIRGGVAFGGTLTLAVIVLSALHAI
jgi:hypothetical protein